MNLIRRILISCQSVIVAAQLVATTAWVASVSAGDQFGPVRECIRQAIVEQNVPSIAVAVARDGQILWEQGFGWADREERLAATEHTTYSMASISKPITATGLMVLEQKKQIDLDHAANEYLGDAKLRARVGDASQATIRRLANHTSGLPLHYQFFYADEAFRPPTRDETIRRYGNLVTAPAERYQYCNLAYGVLDYVIERIAEQPFADFMREEVFLPLAMTHSSIDIAPGLEKLQAIRYTPAGARIPFYQFDHPGASAAYCSAHDLVRFSMFHLKEHLADQKQILSDATIDAMQNPTSSPGGIRGYGIGWATGAARGYKTVGHDGGMPGVSTVCLFVPEKRVAVVVLANTGSPVPHVVSEMVLRILLPDQNDTSASPRAPTNSSAADNSKIDSALIGEWKGQLVTYEKTLPLTLNIKESGDIHVRLGRQLETLLNDSTFRDGFLRGRFAGEIGDGDARGRRYLLHLEVKLRDQVLNGPVMAITLPDGRGSSAVTHWVELKRESTTK